MANLLLQVTIPSGGKAQVSSFLPANNGVGNAVFAPGNIFVQWLTFQNNSAHSIRYGDQSVSVTTPAAVNGGTAGKGMLLAPGSPGGAGSQSTPVNYGTYLSDWWIAGTAGDVIDVLYIQ